MLRVAVVVGSRKGVKVRFRANSDDYQTEHRRPDSTLNGYSISTAAVAAGGNGPAQKGVCAYSAPYRKCRAKRHSQLFLGLHTTCEAFDRASSP
jgi:glutamine synthetase